DSTSAKPRAAAASSLDAAPPFLSPYGPALTACHDKRDSFLVHCGNCPRDDKFRPRRVATMFNLTEAKPQGWRAIALFDDRGDRLVYVDRSSNKVRQGLIKAFFEVLNNEERDHIQNIALQR